MENLTHSQVAYRVGKVKNNLIEHDLKLVIDGQSTFVITNCEDEEYTTHHIFKTFHTIQEVESYIQGIEDNNKLSLPKKERK